MVWGRSRFVGIVMGSAALTAGVLLVSAPAVMAITSCAPGTYYYDGLYTLNQYNGIESDISVDNVTLGNYTAEHDLNYVASDTAGGVVSQTNGLCVGDQAGVCQIQDGYGSGYVGYSNESTQSINAKVYEENSDINGYNVAFYSNLSLAQDDFFNNYYSGINGPSGTGQYDAYFSSNPGSAGATLIGRAYLPSYNQSAEIYSGENALGYNANTNYNCPAVSPYEYFGTNGAGATTFTDIHSGSWTPWSSSVPTTATGGVPPYPSTFINKFQSYSYSGN